MNEENKNEGLNYSFDFAGQVSDEQNNSQPTETAPVEEAATPTLAAEQPAPVAEPVEQTVTPTPIVEQAEQTVTPTQAAETVEQPTPAPAAEQPVPVAESAEQTVAPTVEQTEQTVTPAAEPTEQPAPVTDPQPIQVDNINTNFEESKVEEKSGKSTLRFIIVIAVIIAVVIGALPFIFKYLG